MANEEVDEEFLEHLDTLPLTFGKHCGKSPEDLAKTDPGYVRWMYDNIRPRIISTKLNLAIDEAVQKKQASYEKWKARTQVKVPAAVQRPAFNTCEYDNPGDFDDVPY